MIKRWVEEQVEGLKALVREETRASKSEVEELRGSVASLQESLTTLADQVAQISERTQQQNSEQQLWLEKIATETGNALVHLQGMVENSEVQLKSDIATHIATVSQTLTDARQAQQLAIENLQAETSGKLVEAQQWLEKISGETANGLTHLDTHLGSAVNRLDNEAFPSVNRESHVAAAIALASRPDPQRADRRQPHPEETFGARSQTYEQSMTQAAEDYPHLFPLWEERLATMGRAFDDTMVGNAAEPGELYSEMFRQFVNGYVGGRVLDVGCGVFGKPLYLSDYPDALTYGLEPLPMKQARDIQVVRGIGEYLPWDDNSFSTVISGTSIDHCLSLDRTLEEISRVLRPGGRFLMWVGSEPGAAEYLPDSDDFEPADHFHLFHIDDEWFRQRLLGGWRILERLSFRTAALSHVFYALEAK